MERDAKFNTRQAACRPRVLLIHPPVYDFSAFDFYLYPLGLVRLGGVLMEAGYEVRILDALDRFHPVTPAADWKAPTFRKDGCGHFHRRIHSRPASLADIPRRYHRFGLPGEVLEARMVKGGRPDAVGITCAMTYWYPGVIEMVRKVRALWPGVPVVLGGVYATLCTAHAKAVCEADEVLAGGDPASFLSFLRDKVGAPPLSEEAPNGHALLGERGSAAVRSAKGCPKRCPYCAASILGGPFRQRSPEAVLDEIAYLVWKKGLKHIAFYDDALLWEKQTGFEPLVRGILERGLHEAAQFHCPNALHASAIDESAARLMKEARFDTIRIGFETADADLQKSLGGKATNSDLARAMKHLRRAGFDRRRIGVYILAGLPDQDRGTVEESIRFVHGAGACARLAEYAPVPGTPLFERARSLSRLDLDEPIHQNKTLAAFRFPSLTMEDLRRLKDLARDLNDLSSH